MRPGAALIARALEQPPLTGGLLPGVSCVWWRAPSPEEEWAHRDLLARLLRSPEALTADERGDVRGLLHSLVVGLWVRLPGEPEDGAVGEPEPVRVTVAAPPGGEAQPWPIVPPDVLAGHEDLLLYAVVQTIGLRALAGAAHAAAPVEPPPDGCAAVPTCRGWLAVERAHLPRLQGRQDVRDRCVGVGLTAWVGGAQDAPERAVEWPVLAGDVAALLRWRWADGAWQPATLAVQPGQPGDVWAGSLTAADLLGLWRAGMAPALEAGELVRSWLPAAGEEGAVRPLPSADPGAMPWVEDPAWAALGPEARAWARAAWAVAWQRQAVSLSGLAGLR